MNEALSSSAHVLRTAEPSVTLRDISAEMLDFELSYFVRDIGAAGVARSDLFERVFRAVTTAGFTFASRLAGTERGRPDSVPMGDKARRLLAGIPLFATLTPDEIDSLALRMVSKQYEAGQSVVQAGAVMHSLCIIASGVIEGRRFENGQSVEVGRLASGEYFGENGLLTAEPVNADVTAVTRATVLEISRDAVTPLLARRPGMSQELSETLARRRRSMQSFDRPQSPDQHLDGFADRLAVKIRQLFVDSRNDKVRA